MITASYTNLTERTQRVGKVRSVCF